MNKLLTASAVAALLCSSANATTTYVTDFGKTNNIYTNLNVQYPNTGAGTPGSGVGVADASTFFNPPAASAGPAIGPGQSLRNDVNNGIGFQITSDANGRDFAEIGTPLTFDIGVNDATNLYLLMGAYFGTNINVTLTGTGGATETFTNIYIPDFNGGSINLVAGDVADQTVFQVQDQGAGGSGNSSNGSFNLYSLTEVGLALNQSFAGQTLLSATISGGSTPLLLGATVVSSDNAATVPEPTSWAMFIGGFGLIGAAMRRRKAAMRFA